MIGQVPAGYISIHAPREGGDVQQLGIIFTVLTISIHAPREGGDKAVLSFK